MDIKLKDIRYSKVTKAVAVFLVWLCFMSAVVCTGFLLSNQDIVSTESYYESIGFVEEYSKLVHNIVEYHIKFKNEAGLNIFGDTPVAIARNGERHQLIEQKLKNTVNFAYYIKNTKNGEVFSNLNGKALSLLKEQPSYINLGEGAEPYGVYNKSRTYIIYYDDISKTLEAAPYDVQAALIEPFKPGDVFYRDYTHYTQMKALVPYIIALLIASVLLMLAALVYLIITAGRKEKGGEIVLAKIDKLYTDVHTLLLILAAFLSVTVVVQSSNGDSNTVLMVIAAIILSIDIFVGLSYILSMVRQIKCRQLVKNSLTYKLFTAIREYVILAFNGKLFKAWILLILIGYGAVNGILGYAFLSAGRYSDGAEVLLALFLLLGFNIAAVYFAAKSLRSLTQIMEAAKELSSGNIDYPLDVKEMSPAFAGFAGNLQGVQAGLKKAVAEAIKGERMKTELITNVSHDLKTPLTSIINYVDLLKKEDLNNKNAEEYLDVLDEKSARLKHLVEDLVEASKATSGNLSVNTERVDLNQLVMQAYGEYEEKIEAAALDIRTNMTEKNISILADGKYMWRIVENLLSNVLKYSMPKSRVYINLEKTDNYGVLTIKNISAYPLEISPEQLTERFVRGDASRSTEGSGLGLSIAQSLTTLQGGRFKIEIDGDLFKVTVEMPLWREPGV